MLSTFSAFPPGRPALRARCQSMPGMGDAVRVLSFIALHFQLKSNSIKRKKITIIFSKEKPKKESLIIKGRREGMSRLLRYYFDSIKQLKKASKKYCKTRRAWPWQTWTPTYFCFLFFGFLALPLLNEIVVLLLMRGSADKVSGAVSPCFCLSVGYLT